MFSSFQLILNPSFTMLFFSFCLCVQIDSFPTYFVNLTSKVGHFLTSRRSESCCCDSNTKGNPEKHLIVRSSFCCQSGNERSVIKGGGIAAFRYVTGVRR